MKRVAIVVMLSVVAAVMGGAWYGVHRAPAAARPPRTARTTSAAARGAGAGPVQPDKSWADLFDTLDRQWNDEGKTHVQTISPVAGTPETTQPKAKK